MLEKVLPRHMQIIYEINGRFLYQVKKLYPKDPRRTSRMSIIEEGETKQVRMANLCIVGSHSVNGVAALHTEILKESCFSDFFEMWPEKFNNKTNGITQRRWLKLCNPELAQLITEKIGEGWITDLYQLRRLEEFVNDGEFRQRFRDIKRRNKERFAATIKAETGVEVNIDSMFDCQVKRIHEYKRQLLNILHVIALYNRMKENPHQNHVRAPSSLPAKLHPDITWPSTIIKLATLLPRSSTMIRHRRKLKVVFVPNYSVSIAESLIPSADLSEQISTAGMEASGTGNMKFALNGALTIGTLDGANVEIKEEVCDDNIFIFGLNTQEVQKMKYSGYNPREFYHKNLELRKVIDMIENGIFSPDQPELFDQIIKSLLDHGDQYMLMADFEAISKCRKSLARTYLDYEKWTTMAILNVARMGKFSTDRTIKQYADEIWDVHPCEIRI
jgi:starch phosphorylase